MERDCRWLWAALLPLAAGCGGPALAKREAADVPVVRQAECRWATDRVNVDGILDDKAWAKAQKLTDFAVFWQGRKPATATTARLLWDNQYLYFCAEMEDHDLFALTREANGRTWEDDVFEIFLKPSVKERAYYEFQVNALNTPLELYLPSRGAGGYRRFADEPSLGLESAVKLRGTLNKWTDKDQGWTVEGRIPWTAFKATGGRPKPGDKWKFALCRYDYSVYLERPELSSTAPLTEPDFHRYEDYGELTFVGPAR
jgi:hypothetical protein